MNRRKRAALAILGSLAFLAVVAVPGFSWYVSGRLLLSPSAERRDPCAEDAADCETRRMAELGIEAEILTLRSFDGTTLSGLYFPSRNGAAVIVQHGYRATRGQVLDAVEILTRHGFGVAAVDLRGHGASGGEWITLGRDDVRDLLLVFEHLQAKPEVDDQRIGMIGFSLGGALAVLHAAANPELRAIIVDSPFDVVNAVTVAEFTDLPRPISALVARFMEWRLGVDFDAISPLARIAEISPRPVLVFAAGADTVVDAGSGERLYAAAGEPRQIWLEPDYGHCSFFANNRTRFEDEVVGFFERYLR